MMEFNHCLWVFSFLFLLPSFGQITLCVYWNHSVPSRGWSKPSRKPWYSILRRYKLYYLGVLQILLPALCPIFLLTTLPPDEVFCRSLLFKSLLLNTYLCFVLNKALSSFRLWASHEPAMLFKRNVHSPFLECTTLQWNPFILAATVHHEKSSSGIHAYEPALSEITSCSSCLSFALWRQKHISAWPTFDALLELPFIQKALSECYGFHGKTFKSNDSWDP